jgi:hypothetical protein
LILSNNTTSCIISVLNPDGYINLPWQPAQTEHVGLLGTDETISIRYKGESNEVEYSCWLYASEYAKLVAMIAAQTDSNRISLSGTDYNVEITSPPRKLLGRNEVVFVDLRLKAL